MKAVRFRDFGSVDVLKYEDVPVPEVGPSSVRVRLKAAALNHLDLWVRSGARERRLPLPHIPGSDGAGIVDEVGNAVVGVQQGDKVLISPGISCGHCRYCIGGIDNMCSSYHVLGTLEDGTYAEYVTVPFVNVVPIPEGLDFAEAASIPLVFLTAWHMLVTLAGVRPGETVLVHGAGSGVGSAAIQLAKLLGASVITTAGTEEKLEKARNLGADVLIRYQEQDFVEEIKRVTDKQGVDVVFEHVGGDVLARSATTLRRGGRLVSCGATTEFKVSIDWRYVYSRQLTLFGSWMGTKRELLDVLTFFSNRTLRPVIDSVFPLADAAAAHRRMEERKNFGKIVLTIAT